MDIEVALKNIQLSKNFKAIEFANTKDGFAILLPNPELVHKMQLLRDEVGSIEVISGTRTVEYNKKVGGSLNSYHLDGLAVDCKFNHSKYTKERLTKLFQVIGFTNVNFYYDSKGLLRHFHLDIGKSRNGQKFNYRDKKI
jgi:uncharacterized protein YcbK (DUF882 family)